MPHSLLVYPYYFYYYYYYYYRGAIAFCQLYCFVCQRHRLQQQQQQQQL